MRLLDFGLAQMAEFDTLTALGDIPGTLAYISPERLQGLPATTAADIWARRRAPLRGARGRASVLGRRPGRDLAPHPGRRARPARSLRPDLPEHVCQVVASALLGQPAAPPGGRAPGATSCARLPKRRARRGGGSKPGSPARRSRLRKAVLDRARAARRTGRPGDRLGRLAPAVLPARCHRSASPARPPRSASPRRAPGLPSRSRPRSSRSRTSRSASGCSSPRVAVVWLALTWRDPRAGLCVAVGPLLGAVAALALLPLAAAVRARPGAPRRAGGRRRPARRARRRAQPRLAAVRRLTGRRSGSASTGSTRPAAVADALWRQLDGASDPARRSGRARRRGRAPAARPRPGPVGRRAVRRGAARGDRARRASMRHCCRWSRPPG